SGRHRLLADIGATNVRFALLSNGVLGPIKWFTVADFPRFTDAVTAFLDCHCRQVSVCEALLAVAGPVDNVGVCSPIPRGQLMRLSCLRHLASQKSTS